jgi:hypothetical protein
MSTQLKVNVTLEELESLRAHAPLPSLAYRVYERFQARAEKGTLSEEEAEKLSSLKSVLPEDPSSSDEELQWHSRISVSLDEFIQGVAAPQAAAEIPGDPPAAAPAVRTQRQRAPRSTRGKAAGTSRRGKEAVPELPPERWAEVSKELAVAVGWELIQEGNGSAPLAFCFSLPEMFRTREIGESEILAAARMLQDRVKELSLSLVQPTTSVFRPPFLFGIYVAEEEVVL